MALTAITSPANTDPKTADWQALLAWVEKTDRGYINVTLTELDSTTVPQVASGSVVECNGTGYYAGSNQSISGSASAENLNYIKMVSGTPTWTTTAPTWSAAKGGWYASNDRYIGGCYYDTAYIGKFVYDQQGKRIYNNEGPLYDTQKADLELAGGNVTKRIIYCNNLHVTASTALAAMTIVVDGDLIIDSGVTLTITRVVSKDGGQTVNVQNDTTWPSSLAWHGLNYVPSQRITAASGNGGAGCLGGGDGKGTTTGTDGAGGGGSISTAGGSNGGGGNAGGAASWSAIGIGGAGGNGANANAAGGGAGPGGGGGARYTVHYGGEAGGGCFIVVKGNLINAGTIAANGANGEPNDGGGGAGGLIVIFAMGAVCTPGTITATGGSSTNGGGGGGGHIHIAGHQSTYTNVTAAGGTSSTGTNGGAGTVVTVDLDSDPYGVFGGEATGAYTGWLTRLFEGAFV